MVEMLKTPDTDAIRQKAPLLVELVGLAGAGKTTLLRALNQRDERFQVVSDLEIRNREHLPIFVTHAPFLISQFLRRSPSNRAFTWDEMKAMIYLEIWPRLLRSGGAQSGTATLLNHGPIFKLATLDAFGPERLHSQEFDRWWHSRFEQWACSLDVVVWLKAPEQVLVERINARHQRHTVKGKSEVEAHNFLARYQASYEQILEKLVAYGGPKPLQMDSSQTPVEQIVDEVLLTCNQKLGNN